MKNKIKIDNLDIISFLNGMVFFSPVALLVRTTAGITVGQFFVLQSFGKRQKAYHTRAVVKAFARNTTVLQRGGSGVKGYKIANRY